MIIIIKTIQIQVLLLRLSQQPLEVPGHLCKGQWGHIKCLQYGQVQKQFSPFQVNHNMSSDWTAVITPQNFPIILGKPPADQLFYSTSTGKLTEISPALAPCQSPEDNSKCFSLTYKTRNDQAPGSRKSILLCRRHRTAGHKYTGGKHADGGCDSVSRTPGNSRDRVVLFYKCDNAHLIHCNTNSLLT